MACTWRDGTSVHEGQKGWCALVVGGEEIIARRVYKLSVYAAIKILSSLLLPVLRSPDLGGYP